MQAAASRPPGISRHRRGQNPSAISHLGVADDTGLLNALPIAAAIVERHDDGRLHLTAYNRRFRDTVEQSTCTSLDWNDADCLKSGAIAELLQRFFDGVDVAGELDFKDGEGVASHYFRLKLAPLPKVDGGGTRCL